MPSVAKASLGSDLSSIPQAAAAVLGDRAGNPFSSANLVGAWPGHAKDLGDLAEAISAVLLFERSRSALR
jgi:hypothetical protein